MPKVTQEYIENKRKMIVEAAAAVCMRKTLSSVTMQDIIDESGLSQGGIYRFFSNIDEILAGLLSKVRSEPVVDARVKELLAKYHEPMETARAQKEAGLHERKLLMSRIADDVFLLLAETMKEYLYPYMKIEFEYNVLINDCPDRAKRIYSAVRCPNILEESMWLLGRELRREIADGSIKPLITLEEFFEYNSAVYDGILKRALARGNFERNVRENPSYVYDIDNRFHVMHLAVKHLLGLN